MLSVEPYRRSPLDGSGLICSLFLLAIGLHHCYDPTAGKGDSEIGSNPTEDVADFKDERSTNNDFFEESPSGRDSLLTTEDLESVDEPGTVDGFSLMVFGDIHFDKLEHHDLSWLQNNYPNDLSQVTNYSRITRDILPTLLQDVKAVSLAAAHPSELIVQVGDFTEGLCGNIGLATTQLQEFIATISAQQFGTPFLVTKGNHDITGPGAVEAFSQVVLPFLSEQTATTLTQATYSYQHQNALFLFFDAWDSGSLDFVESTLASNAQEHVFVIVHEPIIPFQARSSWIVFDQDSESSQRARLLNLLGKNRAVVLCGHTHDYGIVVRQTDFGPILQLAMSSVVNNLSQSPTSMLEGIDNYGPDLVNLEPDFSPDTAERRRQILADEKPFITHFEYAKAPGFARLQVTHTLTAEIYVGTGRVLWKTIELSALR